MSKTPAGGASFAKFLNFNPVTGERELTVDLDGRPGFTLTLQKLGFHYLEIYCPGHQSHRTQQKSQQKAVQPPYGHLGFLSFAQGLTTRMCAS